MSRKTENQGYTTRDKPIPIAASEQTYYYDELTRQTHKVEVLRWVYDESRRQMMIEARKEDGSIVRW